MNPDVRKARLAAAARLPDTACNQQERRTNANAGSDLLK